MNIFACDDEEVAKLFTFNFTSEVISRNSRRDANYFGLLGAHDTLALDAPPSDEISFSTRIHIDLEIPRPLLWLRHRSAEDDILSSSGAAFDLSPGHCGLGTLRGSPRAPYRGFISVYEVPKWGERL